jgi:hypothetical protein
VILRILDQESPDSELRLKRYEEKKFGGQDWNFENILGHIWKYRMCGGIMCKKIGLKHNLNKV